MKNQISLVGIKKGIESYDWEVRSNTFKACIGRNDVPLEWLEKGFKDASCITRTTTSKILFDRGYQFPLVRMVEPADLVYKKCKNNVIVVAEIPKTAQVRGSIGKKCRA